MSRSDAFVIAACCLVSGCVAAPLAEMALTPVRSAASPCALGVACPPLEDGSTLASVSQGIGDTLHRMSGP